jgi:hypothetical protein
MKSYEINRFVRKFQGTTFSLWGPQWGQRKNTCLPWLITKQGNWQGDFDKGL